MKWERGRDLIPITKKTWFQCLRYAGVLHNIQDLCTQTLDFNRETTQVTVQYNQRGVYRGRGVNLFWGLSTPLITIVFTYPGVAKFSPIQWWLRPHIPLPVFNTDQLKHFLKLGCVLDFIMICYDVLGQLMN